MMKKIFLGLGLVVLILLVWNWQLVVYGVRRGYGQVNMV